MDGMDRLDSVYQRLSQRLKERTALLELIKSEVETLLDEIGALDAARVIVIEHLSAGEAAVIRAAAPKREAANKLGIQATVLKCVDQVNEPGASASEVVEMVKAIGYTWPGATERTLYSSVYSSLLRLVQKGEIERSEGPRGRVFCRLGPTRPLFPRATGKDSQHDDKKSEGLNA